MAKKKKKHAKRKAPKRKHAKRKAPKRRAPKRKAKAKRKRGRPMTLREFAVRMGSTLLG